MATIAETAKSPFSSIVGIGGMSSLTFCSMQTLRHSCIQLPSDGECRLDEVPIEVAPCEVRLLDEVESNTVTVSNMSIDSKLVKTDGKRGRHRKITVDSCAGESVVDPDDETIQGLSESTTIRGPWR